MNAAVCPVCKVAQLIATSAHHDALRNVAEWGYSCPGCSADITVQGSSSIDPEREITEYGRTGRASCSVAVSRPAPSSYFSGSLIPNSTFQIPTRMWSMTTADPPERRPDPPAPTEPGPDLKRLEGSVIGYRAWRIQDWVLTGTGVSESWVPGVNEAKCSGGFSGAFGGYRHPAPDQDCHCGLYGLARFDKGAEWWSNADVLGAVEAWADEDATNHDRFFVHSIGFRAQYAKVILLATSDDYPRAQNAAIRALASEHGADVCKRDHLEDAAKEHGQLVPDEWLAAAKEDEPAEDGGWYANAVRTLASSYSVPMQYLTPPSWAVRTAVASPPKPKPKKGICQTLGYVGEPNHGKFRKGDRVKDRKGDIYECIKGGQPGHWQQEDTDA